MKKNDCARRCTSGELTALPKSLNGCETLTRCSTEIYKPCEVFLTACEIKAQSSGNRTDTVIGSYAILDLLTLAIETKMEGANG